MIDVRADRPCRVVASAEIAPAAIDPAEITPAEITPAEITPAEITVVPSAPGHDGAMPAEPIPEGRP